MLEILNQQPFLYEFSRQREFNNLTGETCRCAIKSTQKATKPIFIVPEQLGNYLLKKIKGKKYSYRKVRLRSLSIFDS